MGQIIHRLFTKYINYRYQSDVRVTKFIIGNDDGGTDRGLVHGAKED